MRHFSIRSIPDLLAAIREQIEECNGMWGREQGQEIMLSDGPDIDEDDENYMVRETQRER